MTRMNSGYWSRMAQSRLSRRRALALGGAGLGAAVLATLACSGDDDPQATGSSGTQQAGLITPSIDTTAEAVKGGVLSDVLTQDVLHYDPLTGGSLPTFGAANHVYQRLVSFKVGTFDQLPDGAVEGDAISSWETSPDGLTLTMKLRANNRLDPRPPTEGRPLTTEDVRWSWERFAGAANARGTFLNSISPDSPVVSMTFPDESTVSVQLAFPYAALLPMFGTNYYFSVLPVEAESEFDIKNEMRGTGAWMLEGYERSVGWRYRRNPNWFRAAERPFLDGIDYALISEPATRQAQFESGQFWAFEPRADLALSIKRDHPDLELRTVSPTLTASAPIGLLQTNAGYLLLGMSKKPDSPFEKDERVRQAFSMLLDRDGWIDTFYNIPGFEAEGIPMEKAWHSHVPCSWPTIWLDPKAGELGEASKYLQYDPEEAANLLQAAGQFGMESDYTYWTPGWGQDMPQQMEVMAQMLEAGGHFKLNQKTEDYQSVITPQYTFGRGQYDGITVHPFGAWPDWDVAMWNTFTPSGRNDYVGHDFPTVKEIMVRHRAELDPEKRTEIVHEWQREMARVMPLVPFPGFGTSFTLNWPRLQNMGVYAAWGGGITVSEVAPHLWYDDSKEVRPS